MKLGLGAVAALALVTAISIGAATPSLSQSGGYFGQRATQDRDYSRMQSATNRAYKSENVTIGKKKKKKHAKKHRRKHKAHKQVAPKKAHKH